VQTTSAYLLPSFKYIPFLPRVSFDSVQALVKSYLLPTKLHPAHDNLSPIHKDRLLRNDDQRGLLYGVQDVKEILVLICGHGERDRRCGILGPLLRDEFSTALPRAGIQVLTDPVEIPPPSSTPSISGDTGEAGVKARVGLISHIGGHKFAGNVIIYIPPGTRGKEGERHGLAGCGVWYGRVEPRHVEGIVEETVRKGRVIESLFRGGIRVGGEVLGL
jgi:(2Fe-2S) ferredoxin